jgi:hypothetical protein
MSPQRLQDQRSSRHCKECRGINWWSAGANLRFRSIPKVSVEVVVPNETEAKQRLLGMIIGRELHAHSGLEGEDAYTTGKTTGMTGSKAERLVWRTCAAVNRAALCVVGPTPFMNQTERRTKSEWAPICRPADKPEHTL